MAPTLALALEDFVPVFLTLLAFVWLSRMIFGMDRRSGYIAVAGLVLVVLGGLLKAISKLIWVFAGEPVAWMDDSLFILMAPGFALLAWAIYCGRLRSVAAVQPRFVWQMPALFVLLIGGVTAFMRDAGTGRAWFFVLLTLVVTGSTLMLILLIRHAWYYGLKAIAMLFLLYLTLTFVLNGLARTPSPTIGVEWTKQLLNTGAALILAFASWNLWRLTREPSQAMQGQQPERNSLEMPAPSSR